MPVPKQGQQFQNKRQFKMPQNILNPQQTESYRSISINQNQPAAGAGMSSKEMLQNAGMPAGMIDDYTRTNKMVMPTSNAQDLIQTPSKKLSASKLQQ